MSVRSGWTVDFSGLPSPAPPWQRQVVELAVVLDRLAAGDDLADDVDVLARAGQRPRVGLAVPALDDLRAGGAEAEDERGRPRGGRA